MRFVYLLENEPRFQKDIVEAIYEIDPKIQVRIFPQLHDFAAWVKQMMVEGPKAIVSGGVHLPGTLPGVIEGDNHQLVCVISKIEYLGKRQLSLLRKTKDFLVKRKICTAEDPTAFVLTAFDNPEFNVKELEDRILNNVICKPFDKLMLIQHLTFAIDGRHRPSKYSIQNQKTSTQIEMLKEVPMEAISEVGFLTRSDQELTVGSFSKYYGSPFVSERLGSVHAILSSCTKHPTRANEFLLAFSFFGIDPSQTNGIRKKFKEIKERRDEKTKLMEFDWLAPHASRRPANPDISIVLIDDNSQFAKSITETLKRRFKNLQIVQYDNFHDFLIDYDPKAAEQEGKKYPKCFSSGGEIEVQFDPTGKIIKGFVGQIPPSTTVFGSKISDIPSNAKFWSDLLGSQMPVWQDWIKNSFNMIQLQVGHGEDVYFFRPNGFKNENGVLSALLTELTPDERTQFLQKNSKIPKRTDLILAGYRHFQSKPEERWPAILAELQKRSNEKDPPFLGVVASRDFTDAEKRELGAIAQEIFYMPIDRLTLQQKMKFWFPDLRSDEDVVFYTIKREEVIQAAGPVKVSEISEAGLVMSYHRALPVGAFREFTLWQPFEIGAQKPVATCNFVEDLGKNQFSIHFVFFGVTDHFLKAIRVWIRENYILSKDKGGS